MTFFTRHIGPVILFATLIFMQSSCAIRSVYIPVSQNTPLFDTNQQVIADGYLGANHLELQAGYNPARHWAVAGNINFGSGIAIYDVATGIFGYSRDCKWRYELFGGYGYNSNVDYTGEILASALSDKKYYVSSLYSKYYVQPSIGFFGDIKMYKIRYSFSFSTRLSCLYFNDYLFKETDGSNATVVDKEYRNKSMFLLEPCITNKVGIRNLYAVLQVQTISPYSTQVDVRNTRFSQVVLFSAGLQYNLVFKHQHR